MKPRFTSLLYSLLIIFSITVLCTACIHGEDLVSKEEALRIAKSIEASALRRDPKFINNLIDINAFCRRMHSNTHVKIDADIKKGIKTGLDKRQLGREIVQSMGEDGTYKLLRQYTKDNKQHLLFRIYGTQGVGYHDYELVKVRDQVKVADIFLYYTGEALSTTLGNFMNNMINADNSDANLKDITVIRKLVDKQQYQEAKNSYDALPQPVREQKMMMMLNIQITSALGDMDIYLKAIEDYNRLFPHQTNIPLLMIDAYFIKKDYEKALGAVNELDKLVGTDPFQDYYRGLIYKQLDDTANYKERIEYLYAYDPTFEDGALEMINAYLWTKEYDKARKVIAEYRAQNSFNQATLQIYLMGKEGLPADLSQKEF